MKAPRYTITVEQYAKWIWNSKRMRDLIKINKRSYKYETWFASMEKYLISDLQDGNALADQAETEIGQARNKQLENCLREMIELNETTGDPDPDITNRARVLLGLPVEK